MRTMFAVCDECSAEPIYGIYFTRADAEEAILTECEDYVYEIMMTHDPYDVIGWGKEWEWYWDYKFLMSDAGRTFFIQEVIVL